MYVLILGIHSLLRWVVLVSGLLVFARGLMGAQSRRPWTPGDDRAGRVFVSTLDLQFLLGLALYVWLSPTTSVAMQDFGGAMGNPILRFWAVEHVTGMLVALVLAHIGRVRIRKATESAKRHKLAAVFAGLALLAILATIPWPGMAAARPLLRGF